MQTQNYVLSGTGDEICDIFFLSIDTTKYKDTYIK